MQFVAEEQQRSDIRRANVLAKSREKRDLMNRIRKQEEEKEEYMDLQLMALAQGVRQSNIFLHAMHQSQKREKKLLKMYHIQKRIYDELL